MRILVVEDQPMLRKSLERVLRNAGHAVEAVHSITAASKSILVQPPELVVLDRGLPDGDGVEALKRWRADGLAAAVLVLTAQGSVGQRVDGLEAGADDYLVKPFEMEELLARIRALSRRVGSMADVVLKVSDVELNLARAEVRRAGVLLPLRAKELAVLQVLMQRRGRVVSRAQLREACWSDDAEVGSNVEEAVISALRRKLGKPSIIETRRGLGYVVDG